MQLEVIGQKGEQQGSVDVPDAVFARDFNEPLVHQVVNACLSGQRQGTRAQKNRSAARGGGRKPWRQKGTGRARAGTIRSPLWRGGGRAFPASTQNFKQKLNKKMYRGALCSILSELVRQKCLVVIKDLEMTEPKTKVLAEMLDSMQLSDVLILAKEPSEALRLSARNLKHVDMRDIVRVDPVSLIRREKVLITEPALSTLGQQVA